MTDYNFNPADFGLDEEDFEAGGDTKPKTASKKPKAEVRLNSCQFVFMIVLTAKHLDVATKHVI